MQRKLHFNFISHNNELTLAVTEILREQKLEADANPVFDYFPRATYSIFDWITSHIGHFNALDIEHKINSYTYTIGNGIFYRHIDDRIHRDKQFSFSCYNFKLSTNIQVLLPLLGSLDGAIHAMIYHNKGTFAEYMQGAPKHDDLSALCHAAFATNTNVVDFNKRPLSREIAKWICENIPDKQNELVLKLTEFLSLECRSLTPAIRQFLYPRKTAEMMIATYCQGADALTCELLNPAISFVNKDKNLMAHIRNKLSKITKPDVENPVTKEQVHAEISDWFKTFNTRYQKAMWEATIETIVGLLAFDGGFYTRNYTEVQLLQQANIVFNTHGIAELKFTHTQSYRRHYAEGQKLHDILDKELTQICHDLDLHFLPNQNFHLTAVFDEDSSRALRKAGFHYTENYCKELMRNDRLMQIFRFSAVSDSCHNMQILNPHKPLQRMILNSANMLERNEGLWIIKKPRQPEKYGQRLEVHIMHSPKI